MRHILATAAIAAMASTSAFAESHSMDRSQLETEVSNYFETNSMESDTSDLTDEQIAQLHLAITSSDDEGTKRQKVDAILSE